ncbi:MAG TPA: septal ring lytic transglycosylase RlpA family protein, partial [Rhizomicrobium sp.]
AACATAPAVHTVTLPANAGIYKVGNPYQIDGTWYYPREQPNYDETGIASWYGPTFYGHRTANGEMYDGQSMTAAHRTLPLPVNVRVTNLDNGKSVVVRVNDRGPYAKGRIIDLSEAAARELDVIRSGTARVRVTYLARADGVGGGPPPSQTPPEIAQAIPAAPTEKIDTAALNVVPGAVVAPPLPATPLPVPVASPSLPPSQAEAQPNGDVTRVPVPPVTHIYVQVGAFSTSANAARLKDRLSSAGDLFVSPISRGTQTFYRVRSGPYDNVADADAALARVSGLGSNDAQIVVDK